MSEAWPARWGPTTLPAPSSSRSAGARFPGARSSSSPPTSGSTAARDTHNRFNHRGAEIAVGDSVLLQTTSPRLSTTANLSPWIACQLPSRTPASSLLWCSRRPSRTLVNATSKMGGAARARQRARPASARARAARPGAPALALSRRAHHGQEPHHNLLAVSALWWKGPLWPARSRLARRARIRPHARTLIELLAGLDWRGRRRGRGAHRPAFTSCSTATRRWRF
jgi:hypothetical protein